jgi:hypothetical protein
LFSSSSNFSTGFGYIQDSKAPPGPGGIHGLIQDNKYIDPMVVYRQDIFPSLLLIIPVEILGYAILEHL